MSTLALATALIWLIVANLIAMLPSKDHHWSNAYKLIALGVPILIWVAWTNGLLWAAAFLVAAGSVLRWPLLYLWRWVKGAGGIGLVSLRRAHRLQNGAAGAILTF